MSQRFNDVASERRKTRYAIYTCTPTAPDLADIIPLIRGHRVGCEALFMAEQRLNAELAGATYDDLGELDGRQPAFERLLAHVVAGLIDVVLLITARRPADSCHAIDRAIARLSAAGAEIIQFTVIDLGRLPGTPVGAMSRRGGVS